MNPDGQLLYSWFLRYPKICTDSRAPVPGSIFFALSGPSFNGNVFAAQALEGGCSLAVIDRAEYKKDDRYILVDDTLTALQQLARHHRRQLACKIIGITGSNGKTTTKELLGAVLSKRYITLATSGNLNNQIGVPLTLLRLTEETEIAVVEMGASKPGDIRELVEIAEPGYGLITNIGKAHMEGMGGYGGVVKTKTELYDFIRETGGHLFVNTDHAVFMERSEGCSRTTFGSGEDNDVRGFLGEAHLFVTLGWKRRDDPPGSEAQNRVPTRLMGRYNYENLLAAIAVGTYFGVPGTDINAAVAAYVPDNNRSQLIETQHNTLILDAYNANPTSMEAAISNFMALQAGKKMVVLGKMMELGESSAEEHQRIASLAANAGFDEVYLVGELYGEGLPVTRQFSDTEQALRWFSGHPRQGYHILIKGSRANKLEQLKDAF